MDLLALVHPQSFIHELESPKNAIFSKMANWSTGKVEKFNMNFEAPSQMRRKFHIFILILLADFHPRANSTHRNVMIIQNFWLRASKDVQSERKWSKINIEFESEVSKILRLVYFSKFQNVLQIPKCCKKQNPSPHQH